MWYAPRMHAVLRMIQQRSQKRLKGIPKNMGYMRSQSETEKHIARNGIRASTKARREGILTGAKTSHRALGWVALAAGEPQTKNAYVSDSGGSP